MKKKEIKRPENFLGNTRRRRGQKLYAMNQDNGHVYEVEIVKKSDNEFKGNEDKRFDRADYKAEIDPTHLSLFALNKKNAMKKFAKLAQLIIAKQVIKERKAEIAAKKEIVIEGQDDNVLINKETKE